MIDTRAYSGAIYDVIKFDIGYDKDFVLPRDLVPIWNFDGFIFGKAFTAVGRKSSNPDLLLPSKMLDAVPPNSIYILQANDNSRSHIGDLTTRFLKRADCLGAIVQGWARDSLAIEREKFPVWSKGMIPHDAKDRWGIEDFQCEIVIGNIFISPSDYIFADRDGIIIVRNILLDDVLRLTKEKLDKEDEIRTQQARGVSAEDIAKKVGLW